MKKILIALVALMLSTAMTAGSLVKINYSGRSELEKLFSDPNLTVHYYNGHEVYATALEFNAQTMTLLDENAFQQQGMYTLVYCPEEKQEAYLAEYDIFPLMRTDHSILVGGTAMPYKNDGAVAIFNQEAKLPRLTRDFPLVTEVDPLIQEMMSQVNMDSLQATVQHLQDYGSRVWNSDPAYAASDWIAGRMEALGLEVEQQPFNANTYWMGNGPAAPNVIGIQRGTRYPDVYVVCGCHFDSFTWESMYGYGNAPGADDNATGVASVLESARIMTQYEFEYSIVYCAFGCEEMGLFGSAVYASRCDQQGMDIVGYFNNDMNGYLYGDQIHIDLIYPNLVAPIGDYYMNVADVYFPEMPVRHVDFDEGDSDHTSFNNHGYMGIYPFEDYQNYSPYIHTTNDVIGLSVNSFSMSQRYCQMNIGCLAEIANPVGDMPVVECNPVQNFHIDYPVVAKEESTVTLVWEAPLPGSTGICLKYDVYRDSNRIATINNETNFDFSYQDTLSVGVEAAYYVKAIYDDGCEAVSQTLVAIGVPDALNEALMDKASVFPNPVKERLTVRVEGLQKVLVFNSMGQMINAIEAKGDDCVVWMDGCPEGIYLFQIITKNGLATKKVILEK